VILIRSRPKHSGKAAPCDAVYHQSALGLTPLLRPTGAATRE